MFCTVAADIGFNQAPTGGEVGVFGWQGPQGMEVIGKDNNGIDGEGMVLFDVAKGVSQELNVFGMLEEGLALMGDDGEEVGGSWGVDASV